MNKLFILLIFSALLIGVVSASNLNCEMNEHYYDSNGNNINVFGDMPFKGISFSVDCTNNLEKSRIMSLSITNCSPIELCNSFEDSKPVEYLRIKQTLNLFNSKIIDVSAINDSTQINYILKITGINEDTMSFEQSEMTKTILIKNKGSSFIESVGKVILPSNQIFGFIILILFILLIIFFAWKNEIGKKLSSWKIKQKRNKFERGREGYYEQH